MRPPWVILSNRAFRKHFSSLKRGDFILGILALKQGEEFLYSDLYARNILAYPSLLSQHLARSKCFQAAVFQSYMIPETRVIRDRHDLIRALNEYGAKDIQKVVTKQNRFNCGLGIHLWENIETLYNTASFGNLPYPFVLQPFVPQVIDIRVVWLGDYIEAYARKNPYNFRNNLFFGGEATSYHLSPEELDLCREIMARGQFPYAHLDLMKTAEGACYLAEINLRGGLKGALIKQEEYTKKINDLHQKALQEFLKAHPQAVLKE